MRCAVRVAWRLVCPRGQETQRKAGLELRWLGCVYSQRCSLEKLAQRRQFSDRFRRIKVDHLEAKALRLTTKHDLAKRLTPSNSQLNVYTRRRQIRKCWATGYFRCRSMSIAP